MGAAPSDQADPDELSKFVARSAELAGSASNTFNYGLRAYYFGMAALAWFLNSWVFMAGTTFVVAILYIREFHSGALKVLSRA